MDCSPRACSKNDRLLNGKKDIFGGVTVEISKDNCNDEDDFDELLSVSLAYWRETGVRGVWIKIPITQSSLIPVAVKHGLVFHHAKPDFVMMIHWLPTDEPNTLPCMATSYIGAGGFVLNEKNELLVVCERFKTKQHWKLPGGMVDQGEDIPAAVEREVLEETGIKAKFVALMCFRHLHNFRFGCDDMYFVSLMHPLTQTINIDRREIDDARWMDLEEYISSPLVNQNNGFVAKSIKETLGSKKSGLIPTSVIQYNKIKANVYSLQCLPDPALNEFKEDKEERKGS